MRSRLGQYSICKWSHSGGGGGESLFDLDAAFREYILHDCIHIQLLKLRRHAYVTHNLTALQQGIRKQISGWKWAHSNILGSTFPLIPQAPVGLHSGLQMSIGIKAYAYAVYSICCPTEIQQKQTANVQFLETAVKVMAQNVKLPPDTSIPFRCWFKFQLLQFQSNSLSVNLERQRGWPKLLGPLPPMWEICRVQTSCLQLGPGLVIATSWRVNP